MDDCLIYVDIEIEGAICISAENVCQEVINNQVNNNRYEITFTSGFDFEYALNIFGFDISNCTFYNPNGDQVHVFYSISNKLYIESNINLLNHKVIIN
jgi:hypothetical protein